MRKYIGFIHFCAHFAGVDSSVELKLSCVQPIKHTLIYVLMLIIGRHRSA